MKLVKRKQHEEDERISNARTRGGRHAADRLRQGAGHKTGVCVPTGDDARADAHRTRRKGRDTLHARSGGRIQRSAIHDSLFSSRRQRRTPHGRRHAVSPQRPLPAHERSVSTLLHLHVIGSADHRHLRRGQLRAMRTAIVPVQQRERGTRKNVNSFKIRGKEGIFDFEYPSFISLLYVAWNCIIIRIFALKYGLL